MKKKSFTVLAFFLISTFIFAAAVVLLHSTLSSCATNKAQNPLRAMLAEIVELERRIVGEEESDEAVNEGNITYLHDGSRTYLVCADENAPYYYFRVPNADKKIPVPNFILVMYASATEDNMSNIKMRQRDLQTPQRFLMPRFSDFEKFYARAKALKHGLESTVKIGGVSYEIFFTDIDDPTDLPDEIETKIGAFTHDERLGWYECKAALGGREVVLCASYDIAERKIIDERLSYLEGIALRFDEIGREIRTFAAKEIKRSADDFYITSVHYYPENCDQPLTFHLGSKSGEYSDYTLVVECDAYGKPFAAGYVG